VFLGSEVNKKGLIVPKADLLTKILIIIFRIIVFLAELYDRRVEAR
jgi:hypothetical protein